MRHAPPTRVAPGTEVVVGVAEGTVVVVVVLLDDVLCACSFCSCEFIVEINALSADSSVPYRPRLPESRAM